MCPTPVTAANPTNATPGAAQTPADRFIQTAMKFKGQPYLWGGGHGGNMGGPGRVDCSGLVMQSFMQAGLGDRMNGTADMQQRAAKPISRSDLKPGDLCFMGNPAHHVGIYVGNGLVLNAPHTGDVTKLSPVSEFDNFGRIFDQGGQPIAQTTPDGGSSGGGSPSGGSPSGGDSSSVGGGGRPSGMSLPSSGGGANPVAMAMQSSEQEDEQQQQIDAQRKQQAAANSGNVSSGLQNVDSSSVGGLGDIMSKLNALGISQADLQALSQKYGVPLKMILAVIKQESGGDPNAKSGAGAMGLMQLMPGTAQGLGVSNPMDPKQNVEGGVKLLAQNLQANHGDTSLALAAYNAGQGNVDKYGGVPPFAETQNYVKNITAMMNNG